MKARPNLCLAMAAMLLAQAMACGSLPSPTPTPTPKPTPDPQVTLRRAVSLVLEMESAAFTLEHQAGSTILFPGLEMSKASGVVDIPDRIRLRVEAQSTIPRAFVEINVVIIGDQAWMTDFISGQWRQVPLESLPVTFSDLGRTLADIIEAVRDPRLVGSQELEGRDTYRIEGRVQSEDLAALVPGAGEGFEVVLMLWLDQDDGLLRRVLITGQVVPSDIPGAVRLLTLEDINLPVDITVPE